MKESNKSADDDALTESGTEIDLGFLDNIIDLDDFAAHIIPTTSSTGSSSVCDNNSSSNSKKRKNTLINTSTSTDTTTSNSAKQRKVKSRKKNSDQAGAKTGKISIEKIRKLISIPGKLFEAVNSADSEKLEEIIETMFTANCTVQTPALDQPLCGSQNVLHLFNDVTSSHPDVIFSCSGCKYDKKKNSIYCRINVQGTRVLKFSKLYNSGYIRKKGESIVKEFDPRSLSKQEAERIVKFESSNKNLCILAAGTLTLGLNVEYAVSSVVADWRLTSVQPTEISK